MKEKKLILYISMSLDGYLATKDDDISWLSIVERKGEDENGVSFYNGDLAELITQLKKEGGKNIFCDAGAMLVKLRPCPASDLNRA